MRAVTAATYGVRHRGPGSRPSGKNRPTEGNSTKTAGRTLTMAHQISVVWRVLVPDSPTMTRIHHEAASLARSTAPISSSAPTWLSGRRQMIVAPTTALMIEIATSPLRNASAPGSSTSEAGPIPSCSRIANGNAQIRANMANEDDPTKG